MLFLTHDELTELTGRKRAAGQVEALRAMGIMHRVRPDGFPLVLRAHIAKEFGAEQDIQPDPEPDWSTLDAA